jgi:Putative beta barrel porin-7 (BBP7)
LNRTSTAGVPFQGVIFGPGNVISSVDSFRTRNQFYGGQIGARASYTRGNFFGELDAKLAIGDTHGTVDVSGSSSLTSTTGNITTAPGGLFAGPSKLGRFSQDEFSWLPEVELKVGYKITRHANVFVGYNFTYWTDVLRPGDQVNRNIDTREIPTSFNFTPGFTAAPVAPAFNHTDFWAQGINFGLQFRF